MSAVKIFTCEGRFAFLEEPQRFTFRVFADKGLSVDVAPLPVLPSSDRRDAGESSLSSTDDSIESSGGIIESGGPAPDASGRRGDDGGGGGDAQPTDRVAPEVVVEEEEARGVNRAAGQEHATKVFAFDGRALAVRSGSSKSKRNASGRRRENFIVRFKLVRWCRDPYSTQFIKVVGQLSSKHGLSGKCIDLENAMEEDAESEELRLRIVAPADAGYCVEPVRSPLFPLTPGLYVLNGHTIGENGYVYECQVRLTLQPDGRAIGASRELLFPQECVLAGSWTRDEVSYVLQYRMQGNQCTYVYFGSPFADGLRGSWQNADLSAFGSRAERGCLEFRLVEAARVWSTAFHLDYPSHFRECVKLLLLMAMRAAPGSPRALPSHLVLHVVSFFGYDWFQRSSPYDDSGAVDGDVWQDVDE